MVLSSLNSLLGLVGLALFVLKAFTLIDCATRRTELFVAASKQTKIFWMIILGIATVWNFISPNPIGIINLIGLVAAIVYMVDVRPALRSLGGGGGRRGRRSNSDW